MGTGRAGEATIKGAVGEAVKDAYDLLKTKLSRWAASDVSELEKAPDSKLRQAVIAAAVDRLSGKEQGELRELAQALTDKLKAQPPIGLDIGRLIDASVEVGKIEVTEGTGVRIQEAQQRATIKTGDIRVGTLPGKQ